MGRAIKFHKSSASVNSRHSKDYLVPEAIINCNGMPSTQVAAESGIPYRNFNRRASKVAGRLTGFVRRQKGEGRQHLWFLEDQWKGKRRTDILAAYRGQRA